MKTAMEQKTFVGLNHLTIQHNCVNQNFFCCMSSIMKPRHLIVTQTGLEPVISTVKGWCPKPIRRLRDINVSNFPDKAFRNMPQCSGCYMCFVTYLHTLFPRRPTRLYRLLALKCTGNVKSIVALGSCPAFVVQKHFCDPSGTRTQDPDIKSVVL